MLAIKIMFFLMVIIFYSNAIFLKLKYNAKSLSSEWYYLKGNYKYIFPIVTMIYSTLIIIIGLQFTEWVLFGVTLFYVAAAPEYLESGTKSVTHSAGAAIAVIGSQIMLFSLGFAWLSIFFIALTYSLYLLEKKAVVYWAEICAFTSVVITYYFLLF